MLFTLAVVVGKLMPQGISSSQVNGLECFFCFLRKSLIESWGTEFSLNPVPVIKYFNYVMSKTFTTSFIWIFLVPKIADAEVFADLDQENWGEADSKLSVSVLL